jgi:hypothetical protein
VGDLSVEQKLNFLSAISDKKRNFMQMNHEENNAIFKVLTRDTEASSAVTFNHFE